MKKNIFFALFSAMLLMTACQQHEIDSPADLGDGFTLLGYTDAQTKTAFGTPGASTIPFLWSEGDKIWNNGAQSDPASLSNDGATALFSFTSGSMADQVYYNMTGASATGAHVKSEQTIGNLGANGDFGYATVNEGSFTLNHATAYLWFNVTSDVENATLESIDIEAYGANIAGKATWNGTSFENLTEASNSVTLTVGETLSSTNENVWAMVIFPSTLTGAKVTYKLTVGDQTKYFYQELNAGKTLAGGETARISANITSEGLKDYELRVLTFEDADAKFSDYVLEYCSAEISTWSDLIDQTQYSGDILYSMSQTEGDYYSWTDENNTFLAHHLPYNYYTYCYWGGGHAISNYVTSDYVTYGNYEYQLTVYNSNTGDDVVFGGGGHNGSDNFCVHFGYMDGSAYNYTEELPSICFSDGTPRVIDHMWVANTAYALNCFGNGNSLTEAIKEGDSVYLTATGYDENDTKTGQCTIYLVNGPDNIVDRWVKWDLSSLGEVCRVDFNVLGTSDNGYGFSQPAYFAYDDVAVRFTIE